MRRTAVFAMGLILAACRATPVVGTGGTAAPGGGGLQPVETRAAAGIEEVAAFSGTVIDRTTGKGVEGATVALKPNDPERSGLTTVAVRTMADGAFSVDQIVPGRYVVDVSARTYGATKATVYFSPSQVRKGYRYQLQPAKNCPTVVPGKKAPACP